MSEDRLQGLGVLVTRPAHQAEELVAAIEAAGGVGHRFPVLDIQPAAKTALRAEIEQQPSPDIVIFVSANAVNFGYTGFADCGAHLAAVGPTTAAAIAALGGRVDIVPEAGYDSAHLLTVPALQRVEGKTVSIVRGQSGRELLADTLRHRGAKVHYVSAYRRVPRTIADEERDRLEARWQRGDIGASVVLSVATLEALIASLSAAGQRLLGQTPLVAPSERVIQTALERLPGVRCIQSQGPTPANIVEALAKHDRKTTR